MDQGARTDLLAVKRSIDDGATEVQLWGDHFAPMVRYHRAFREYKRSRSAPRLVKPAVLLIVGPPGTQKTTLAWILARSGFFGSSFYRVPAAKGSGLYFDGYDGHECVIFDEFDGNRCTPTFLNELCHEFPMSVPVHHGGNVNFVAKTIIIVSNYAPKYWWRRHNIASFNRRVTLRIFRPAVGVRRVNPRTMPPLLGNYRMLIPTMSITNRSSIFSARERSDKGKEEAEESE